MVFTFFPSSQVGSGGNDVSRWSPCPQLFTNSPYSKSPKPFSNSPYPKAPSPFFILPSPPWLACKHLPFRASCDNGSDQTTMGTEVSTTSHRPGDYGLRIGRRRVACTRQHLQFADIKTMDLGWARSSLVQVMMDCLRSGDNDCSQHPQHAKFKHHYVQPRVRASTFAHDHCYANLRLRTIAIAHNYICTRQPQHAMTCKCGRQLDVHIQDDVAHTWNVTCPPCTQG